MHFVSYRRCILSCAAANKRKSCEKEEGKSFKKLQKFKLINNEFVIMIFQAKSEKLETIIFLLLSLKNIEISHLNMHCFFTPKALTIHMSINIVQNIKSISIAFQNTPKSPHEHL